MALTFQLMKGGQQGQRPRLGGPNDESIRFWSSCSYCCNSCSQSCSETPGIMKNWQDYGLWFMCA